MSQRPQNCGTGFCSCIKCLVEDKPPTVTMLPHNQLAKRLALEHAIKLVKEAGYDLVPRQTLGCEGPAQ